MIDVTLLCVHVTEVICVVYKSKSWGAGGRICSHHSLYVCMYVLITPYVHSTDITACGAG